MKKMMMAVATCSMFFVSGCNDDVKSNHRIADSTKVGNAEDVRKDTLPPIRDNRFVVRMSCGDISYSKILMRVMTNGEVQDLVGCQISMSGYNVRTWTGSQYVILKSDQRMGIPQVLLDYGVSNAPRIEGSVQWNVPIVFIGIQQFPLENGSVISAALFARRDGMTNVRVDYGGMLDVYNDHLDTLVGKFLDVNDTSADPGIGLALRRLLKQNFATFADNSQLPNEVKIVDGYIVSVGCKQHLCGTQEAIYSINLKTKMISAAHIMNGRIYFYGENSESPKMMASPIVKWANDFGMNL